MVNKITMKINNNHNILNMASGQNQYQKLKQPCNLEPRIHYCVLVARCSIVHWFIIHTLFIYSHGNIDLGLSCEGTYNCQLGGEAIELVGLGHPITPKLTIIIGTLRSTYICMHASSISRGQDTQVKRANDIILRDIYVHGIYLFLV